MRRVQRRSAKTHVAALLRPDRRLGGHPEAEAAGGGGEVHRGGDSVLAASAFALIVGAEDNAGV